MAGLVALPTPERMVRDFTATGEVLTVDRFGNVQLSVTAADAAEIGVKPGGTVLMRLGHRQADAALPGYVRRGGRRRAGGVHGQRGTGLGGGERRERGPATRIAARRADIDHGDTPKYSSVTHSTHGDRMARLRQAGLGHRRRRLARPVSEELSDQVSHPSFRSTLVSVASGLAAAIAISWVCGPAPARAAAGYGAAGRRRPGSGVVAGRPAREAGLAVHRGRRDHRGRAGHGRRHRGTRTSPAR